MRTNYIDDDTASAALAALDIVRAYKLMYERGCLNDTFSAEVDCSQDDIFYTKYELLEMYGEDMFASLVDYHEVNNKEDEIHEHFQECAEWFDYDNYGGVTGLVVRHEGLIAFMDLCDKFDVEIESTSLDYYIGQANNQINRNDWYSDSYMEIFIPSDKDVRKKYPLCFFFTDCTLFDSKLLEYYYEAIDYCEEILKANPTTKEAFLKAIGGNL